MLANKTLLTASNLNNAYISKVDTNAQSINSTLTISGGALTLKNSVITDNASSSYLRIDPQGNNVIIYDGVNNQRLDVFSSSGSESTYLTTINGTKSIGQIDVTSAIDHLEIATNTNKNVIFGGGSVGIGTSSPSTKMHVFTNADAYGLTIGDTAGSSLKIAGTASGDMGYGLLQMFSGSTAGRNLVLQRDAGNVGIGTITPSYKLDVNGGVNIQGANALTFGTYGGGFFMQDANWIRTWGSKSFYHNSGEFRTDGVLEVGNAGATLSVSSNGNFNYKSGVLFANQSNQVGVGTTSPRNKFDVQGGAVVIGTNIQSSANFKDGTLSVGDTTRSYSGSQGGQSWDAYGDTITLQAKDYSTIAFLQSGIRLDYIRGGAGNIDVGYDGGWGRSNVLFANGTWDNTGNLGIGTQSPSYPLHIHKSSTGTALYVENTGSNDTLIELNSTGDNSHMIIQTNEITTTTGDLWIQNNAHNLFLNPAGGLLGINTTSPKRTVDIVGDLRVSGNLYGGTGTLNMYTDAGGALPVKVGSLAVTSSYSNGAPANGLYVQGWTGIGTTSPQGQLHVVDTAMQMYTSSDHLYLQKVGGAQYPYIGFLDSGGTRGGYIGWGATGSHLDIALENNNNLYINLTNGTNKVGIGTATPSQTLDVAGNIQTSSTFMSNSTSADIFQAMGASGIKTFRWEGGNLRFWTSQNGVNEAMTLSSNGNIGINQVGPSYKLDVNGDIRTMTAFRATTNNTQALYVGSNSAIWDINTANTMGLYGQSNTAVGGLKLGSTGPTLYGSGGTLGIGTTTPWTTMALDVNGSIRVASGKGIYSGYNSNYILNDHANGNITLSAAGGSLYLGYQNTSANILSAKLLASDTSTNIIGTDGTLYYKGQDADTRYINTTGDTITNTLYASSATNNSGYQYPAIQIREYNLGGSQTGAWSEAPHIAFHWSGRVASQIAMDTGGVISIRNNPGTDYESFKAKDLNAVGNLNLNNTSINSVSYINGQYGLIAQSTDEWLRINGDNSHTNGIYFGNSITRTDGQLQVGTSGSKFLADANGNVTLAGNLKLSSDASSITSPNGYNAITFHTGNSGNAMVIGAGGYTILGSGESAINWWNGETGNAYANADTEVLALVSDNEIYMYANQQPGFGVSGNTQQYMKFESGGDTKLSVYNIQTSGNQNSSIEIRAEGGGLAYLDFAAGSTNDFDGRILQQGGNMQITATDLTFNNHRVYRHYDNIKWGSGTPSGGQDGDIWIQI
jgi:hypothetical protein